MGSINHKTSDVIVHANSDQHLPIARSVPKMDETTKKRMERKFEICYLLAKENMSFRTYPTSIYELEVKHGVNLGQAYKTKDSARQYRKSSLSKLNFYSFLMDRSTDSGNIEDELIVLMYCMKDDVAQKLKVFCSRSSCN